VTAASEPDSDDASSIHSDDGLDEGSNIDDEDNDESLQSDDDEGSVDDEDEEEAVSGEERSDDEEGSFEVEAALHALVDEEIDIMAANRGLVRRPSTAKEATRYSRRFVPSPSDRLEARTIRNSIVELRLDPNLSLAESLEIEAQLFRDIIDLEYMAPMRAFCSTVDEAVEKLEGDCSIFVQMFGFSVAEAKELASRLFDSKRFKVKGTFYNTEECMLVMLARMRQVLSSYGSLERFFQRSTSVLVAIFQDTCTFILDNYRKLISVEYMVRFKPIVDLCKDNVLEQYRTRLKDPDALLPPRYRGVGAFMFVSKFPILQRGLDEDANVEQSEHVFSPLAIVLPNGLYACVTFEGGLTDNVNNMLKSIELPVLADFTFGRSRYVRGKETTSRVNRSEAERAEASALRIPDHWTFAKVKRLFPLTTTFTKSARISPQAIIELAVLLKNFRTCIRGDRLATSLKMLPPTLRDYLNHRMEPSMRVCEG